MINNVLIENEEEVKNFFERSCKTIKNSIKSTKENGFAGIFLTLSLPNALFFINRDENLLRSFEDFFISEGLVWRWNFKVELIGGKIDMVIDSVFLCFKQEDLDAVVQEAIEKRRKFLISHHSRKN